MKITNHVSPALLEEFLKESLSSDTSKIIRLHLSYCVLCKELCEELGLKLAINQMWDAYEQSGRLQGQHIEAETFKQFWKGEIKDKKLLDQISSHCIVCRSCRHKRRNTILSMNYQNLLQIVGLLSILKMIGSRHKRLIGIIATAALIGAIAIYNWESPKPPIQSGTDKRAESTDRPPEVKPPETNNVTPTPPSKKQMISSMPNRDKKQSLHLPRQALKPNTLVAWAKEIDLNLYGTESKNRGLDAHSEEEEPIEVLASRIHWTGLPLRLPEESKKGWYIVRIKDPFLKRTLGEGRAWSADGKRLKVIIDMRKLSQDDNYYLSVKPKDEHADIYQEPYQISISYPSEAEHKHQGMFLNRKVTVC